MKKLVPLFFIILCVQTFAQWEQRTTAGNFAYYYNFGKIAYFACGSNLVTYDLETNKFNYRSAINSDIPGNHINSLLMLKDSTILISTNYGLATLKNDIISVNDNFCTGYPDSDSRNLYMDSVGNIWTFSSHNVYRYKNSEWRSYDLTQNISHSFDIISLFIQYDKVWVLFEDNDKTTTTYYSTNIDDQLQLAIIEDTSVVKTFLDKKEYPQRQGTLHLFDFDGDVVLKNYDSTYIYQNEKWINTQIFNIDSTITPFWYYNFFNDGKGNVWYLVSNKTGTNIYPVSYDLKTKTKTEHLKEYINSKVTMLTDGSIIAFGSFAYFIKNDTGWVMTDLAEKIGLTKTIYFNPLLLDGFLYLYVYYSPTNIKQGTFLKVDNIEESFNFQNSFPFTSVEKFGINQQGKGIFKGRAQFNAFIYETDTNFVKIENINMNSVNQDFKPHANGKVYISGYRDSTNKMDAPYLTTWSDSGLENIDMGFKDKTEPVVIDFDFMGDMVAALGEYYYYEEDSLNTYLTIFNTKTNTIIKYDKNNSCMPDWYYFKQGLFWMAQDTQVRKVTIDKNYNIWIGTSYSLIKFGESGCGLYALPDYDTTHKISYDRMAYDSTYNELLFWKSYGVKNQLFIFDLLSEKWDSLNLDESGLNGKLTDVKKLLDNRIWASDDQGYLYNYAGKGKFTAFDLRIKNKPNLGVKINDFSIDANNYLHLGTDLGLLTNKFLLTSIKENKTVVADILISPNPASDYIEINIPRWRGIKGVDGVSIRIFDILGMELPTSPKPLSMLGEGAVRIDVSGLAPGVYFVHVGDMVQKFVKM